MMGSLATWAVIVSSLLILCFGFVLLFGAPYLPTLGKQVKVAIELMDLKPGQTLLELGCGDGKVLRAAAKQGWNAVGYELNPLLAAVAWLRTLRYRKQVKIVWGDFWRKDWPPCDGIFTFALPRFMPKLDKKIAQSTEHPVKLVSFAFTVPSKRPMASREGVYLYEYR
ncbi:MAG TPA: methyltransferase domain-containing protein [Candidatus Saccharimonadales bacterium]|nr:methyltransferase domain-containing protein [Candidatus Saccharimonadales bacterium]